jgi:hypothetical protein
MVAEEVFKNCYNFYPTRVKNASIHVKKYQYSSQKMKFSRYLIKVSVVGAGARAAIRICGFAEPEPKQIFSAP